MLFFLQYSTRGFCCKYTFSSTWMLQSGCLAIVRIRSIWDTLKFDTPMDLIRPLSTYSSKAWKMAEKYIFCRHVGSYFQTHLQWNENCFAFVGYCTHRSKYRGVSSHYDNEYYRRSLLIIIPEFWQHYLYHSDGLHIISVVCILLITFRVMITNKGPVSIRNFSYSRKCSLLRMQYFVIL